MSFWRRMAGLDDDTDNAWPPTSATAGSPSYESTLARLLVDDEATLRETHEALVRMGALPASRIAARRLRDAGARDIDLGPRRATQQHPAGLTPRERDVVVLLAEGLRNSEIADRLVISRRTVDHHVAAIMRKVDARTRGEAVARIAEIELALA
jgi:DNA-binding NarL/FixJ family response regulator